MNRIEIELNVLTSEISKAAEKYGVDKRFTPAEQLKEILKKSEEQFNTNIEKELEKGNSFFYEVETYSLPDRYPGENRRQIKYRILLSEEKAQELLLSRYNWYEKEYEKLVKELNILLYNLSQDAEKYYKTHPIMFRGIIEDKNGFTITHGFIVTGKQIGRAHV